MLEIVILKLDSRNILLHGLCLNDKHMSYMKLLLKTQLSSVLGLKSTLIAERHGGVLPQNDMQVLLFHDNQGRIEVGGFWGFKKSLLTAEQFL